MKQLLFLCLLASLFIACQQTSSPAKEDTGTPKDSTAASSSNHNEAPEKEPVSAELEIGPAVTKIEILASKKAEGEPGEQDIKIDLGKGYTLEEQGIWFSGVEWSSKALAIKKDGKILYTWDDDDRNIVIRNRKFEKDYPRLITKGDKTLVMFDIVIPPNGMAIDAVEFENDEFVGVKENIKDTYLDEPETIKKLF